MTTGHGSTERKRPESQSHLRRNTDRSRKPHRRQTPNPYTNTPGARYSAAGWTDKFGNLFLFGGDGWELSGGYAADTYDAPMNDMWVCVMTGDYCQWQLVGGYDPTAVGASTIGAQVMPKRNWRAWFRILSRLGLLPDARLGAATWTDSAGNFWLSVARLQGCNFSMISGSTTPAPLTAQIYTNT